MDKKFNVIEIDEDLLGKVEDLKGYLIEGLKYTLSQEDISEEEKENVIDITNEILINLREYDEQDILRLKYNPMGTYIISEDLNG